MACLSRVVLEAILAEAGSAGDEECCGLLLAQASVPAGHIDAILPARNVATDRRRRFEIDPAVLIAAHRAERAGGPRIVGCFHSHPYGDPLPSVDDAAQAEANGWFWVICGGSPRYATVWRAIPDGPVQGRFERVEMRVGQ